MGTGQRSLELYARSLTPNPNSRMDDLIDRIERLAANGTIADYEVYLVGEEICPETAMKTNTGRQLCARVQQFRDWANRNDKRIEPFFPTTTVRSTFTGDDYEAIKFPTVAMAEFVDGRLRFVTPCTDGDVHRSPHDRLAELAGTPRTDTGADQVVE